MKLKNKWKRFWTLERHANHGFTLVELIVVIAILGILAGAGTAGYAGYMKQAKKKADQALVSNIVRAIEVGTQSTMFTHDDSFKMGEIAYPVGFVALSNEGGTQIVTSTTEVYPATEGACEWETITGLVKVENKTKSYLCEKQRNIAYSEVTELAPVVYCKTHSAAPIVQELTGNYVSGWNHEQGTKTDSCLGEIPSCENGCGKFELVYTDYTDGAKAVTNLDALYVKSANDGNKCEAAYANQYGTYGNPEIGAAIAGDPVLESIKIAFGSDLSSLKLEYDGWVNDEGVDYATFYTSAPGMMEDIEFLSGLLAPVSGIEQIGCSKKYNSGDEVLVGVAESFSTTYASEAVWLEEWNAAADATWDSENFGLTGRENYSAARMGYNNAFASYVESRDSSFAEGGTNEAYLTEIKEFYSKEMMGVGLPGLICTDAFTDNASPLKSNINNDTVFDLLAGYFKDYKDSDACEENGKVFYKVLATFDDTSDVANAYAELHGGSIYDYYNGYVDEISELYSQAQEAAQGGIVIIVTVDGGDVVCDVSPSSADLRLQ